MYYRGSLDVDLKVEAYPISNPTDYQMPVRWVPDKNAAQLEVGCNVIARRIHVSMQPGACSQHQHAAVGGRLLIWLPSAASKPVRDCCPSQLRCQASAACHPDM